MAHPSHIWRLWRSEVGLPDRSGRRFPPASRGGHAACGADVPVARAFGPPGHVEVLSAETPVWRTPEGTERWVTGRSPRLPGVSGAPPGCSACSARGGPSRTGRVRGGDGPCTRSVSTPRQALKRGAPDACAGQAASGPAHGRRSRAVGGGQAADRPARAAISLAPPGAATELQTAVPTPQYAVSRAPSPPVAPLPHGPGRIACRCLRCNTLADSLRCGDVDRGSLRGIQ
jgi:hypothetical protein